MRRPGRETGAQPPGGGMALMTNPEVIVMSARTLAADAILSEEDLDSFEAWTPDDFDHFTDVGLLAPMRDADERYS